jgi:hypothetical protein
MQDTEFTTLPRARAGGWTLKEMSLKALFDAFSRHATLETKDGPNIIGAVFRPGIGRTPATEGRHGKWRQTHLIERVTLLMLDIDGKIGEDEDPADARSWTPEEIREPWLAHDLISYSTWSHGTPAAVSTCMRIILPYSRPVSVEEHGAIYDWAIARHLELDCAPLDTYCRDATRLMYTPRKKNPDATIEPFVTLHETGSRLDPDKLPGGTSVTALLEAARKEAKAKEDRRAYASKRAAERRAARQAATGRGSFRTKLTLEQRAERELDRACDDITNSATGERRPTLYRAASWIGRWVGAGQLCREHAISALSGAAQTVLPEQKTSEIRRQVINGIRCGELKPVEIDDDERPAPPRQTSEAPSVSPDILWPEDEQPAAEPAIERPANAPPKCQACTIRHCPSDCMGLTAEDQPCVAASLYVPESIIIGEVHARDNPERLTMAQIWAKLEVSIKAAVATPGVSAIQAPAGSRKSTITRQHMIDFIKADPDRRASIVLPTHNLADEYLETLEDLTSIEPGILPAKVVTRTALTCPAFPAYVQAARVHPDGGKEYCNSCPRNGVPQACRFFADQGGAKHANVLISTHSLEMKLSRADSLEPVDLQIIDESPAGAARVSGSFDGPGLAMLELYGELSNRRGAELRDDGNGSWQSPLERLRALICKSELAPDKRFGREQLQEACDAIDIRFEPRFAQGLDAIAAALHVDDSYSKRRWETQRELLKKAPAWEALEALRRSIDADWAGAYMQGGSLHITAMDAFPTDHATSTLYLDATTTEGSARALFQRPVQHMACEIKQPEHLKVYQVMTSTGTRSGLAGVEGPKTTKLGAAWISGILRWCQDEKSLNIINKAAADLDAEEVQWTAPVIQDAPADSMHHQGPDCRGVNTYRDHHTARMDSWFVPRGVIESTADMMMAAVGADRDDDLERERWREEAEWQHVGATMLQSSARIRPFDATAEEPKALFIYDERDVTALGFEHVTQIDPGLLAWETIGHLPPVDEKTGKPLMSRVIGQVLERAGGMFLPSVDEVQPDPMTTGDLHKNMDIEKWTRLLHPRHIDLYCDGTVKASTRLESWRRRHFHGSWTSLASAAGCSHTTVQTDRGGRATPVLYTGELDHEQLVSWLRHTGAKRYKLKGERRWRSITGLRSRLATALAGIKGLDEERTRVGDVVFKVSEITGVSTRQVRRWIDDERLDDEKPRQALWRIWSGVHAERNCERIVNEARAAVDGEEDISMRDAMVLAAGVVAASKPTGAGAWRTPEVMARPDIYLRPELVVVRSEDYNRDDDPEHRSMTA